MSNEIAFPKITRTEVNVETIKGFTSEDQFVGLSVDFLIETGSWIVVAANIFPADTRGWNYNQAIVGGHLVRLYKLISGMLDQTCRGRREISDVLGRLAFECIINLRFLIKHSNEEVFWSYRAYSLKSEKKLKSLTEQRTERRGGKTLPVEERILNYIAKSFEVSGISFDEVILTDFTERTHPISTKGPT